MARGWLILAATCCGCTFEVGRLDEQELGSPDLALSFDLAAQSGDLAGADLASSDDLVSLPADLLQSQDLVLPPDMVVVPVLTVACAAVTATIDLTTEGAVDWVHVGLTAVSDRDEKVGGTAIATVFAFGAAATRTTQNCITSDWSDGTPTASASTASGVIVEGGTARGFTFDVAAGTTARTLRVYLGGNKSTSQIDLSLSDNSVTAKSASYGNNAGGYMTVCQVSFRAAAAAQTLHVVITESVDGDGGGGGDRINIQSITVL